MSNHELTVIITPRDRYSGLDRCIKNLYKNTDVDFTLFILDLAYPKIEIDKAKKEISGKDNVRIFDYGLITPMQALEQVRGEIDTLYTVLLDNDSDVTEGWLPPLIQATDNINVIVSPLILEKEGVDEGMAVRNHLHTCDIRLLKYENKDYLIENKKFRRAPVEDLPSGIKLTDTFELHCVLFVTSHLMQIEIPQMVVREHIDIGLQTRKMGKEIVVQPDSRIMFDNLGTRMNFKDMKFFFYRWNKALSIKSHQLFEERWGYKFYAENAMYVWAFRRKVFLISRYLYLPISLSNKISSVMRKLFCRDWDPVSDPVKKSEILRNVLKDNSVI